MSVRTVPLRYLVDLNGQVLPETSPPDLQFKYIDISQVNSSGQLSIPDDTTTFASAPSRARRIAAAGDTVVSTVRTYLRAITAVPDVGDRLIFSTGFAVLSPRQIDSRFLAYVCRSEDFVHEVVGRSVGVSYPAIAPADLLDISVRLPSPAEQRRIADFLDDRVSRIDRIIAARREQIDLASESRSRLSYDVVRGVGVPGPRRDSGLEWLGEIPVGWGVLSVGSQFAVELGKMLDDKQQTGNHSLPYLRNTNVQWDAIYVDDLKKMDISRDEYPRYTVRTGDLLICEGGQPGRSAIWTGNIEPLGFQKALHRARSRGRARPGWLLECLRVAVDLDVFAAASGQTTIAHLTNEQLRGQRFPFPGSDVQEVLLRELADQRETIGRVIDGLSDSIDLLTEYKSSLITAAVTGELDVTTAGSRIPG